LQVHVRLPAVLVQVALALQPPLLMSQGFTARAAGAVSVDAAYVGVQGIAL
jgi:hypothetical protein